MIWSPLLLAVTVPMAPVTTPTHTNQMSRRTVTIPATPTLGQNVHHTSHHTNQLHAAVPGATIIAPNAPVPLVAGQVVTATHPPHLAFYPVVLATATIHTVSKYHGPHQADGCLPRSLIKLILSNLLNHFISTQITN